MREYRVKMGAGALLWLVVVIVAGMPGWSPAQSPTPGPGFQAWQLRKEQAEVLEKAVKQYEELHRAGRVGFVEIIPLRKELLSARLGQGKELAARVAILKTEIEQAKTLEAIVKAQFEAGSVTQSELLLAKAYRLGVEIQLADAKASPEGRRVRRQVVLPKSPEEK